MLTPRTKMIAQHINADTVLDIGTDHAYIPIYLAQNKLAKKIIATDLRKGPLMIAEANIIKYGLEDKIELRLGEGLSPVEEDEADTIIIAGMGGELISNILNDGIKKAERAKVLVLQPMNSQEILRRWLIENGFSITEEDIALEGFKVYNLIIAKKGNSQRFLSDFDYHIPPYLKEHQYFDKFKEKKLREFNKIKTGLENAKEKNEEEIEKFKMYITKLEEM